MKRKKTLFLLLAILAPMFFSNCNLDLESSTFNYSLRGHWVSPSSSFERLDISFDTITIRGSYYYPSVLDGFSINTPLSAYSTDDRIYIRDGGHWRSIPYTRWTLWDNTRMLSLGTVNLETFRRD
jgi:hypothetical protein